jgi:quercetin dioxygenase-like cupin family protein
MRATFEPGWKWSECVKPKVGGDSCQVHHVGYLVSGKMKVVMNDDTEIEGAAGDVVDIPPGHNAWVVGDEPVVTIDYTGGTTYAK